MDPAEITTEKESVALYAPSEKIYPREVKGTFQTLRNLSVFALLGIYYLAPWLQWDDRQAILFDLPARKFHIFALTLWPQDFIFLTLLLIIAGLSLFFFTAMAGRVWCGYACPQTVWTEAFIWMERWVEGSRAKQMKLSAAPWSLGKIRKRVTKQFLWITFALFTGLTFVGYFTPIQTLMVDFVNLELAGWTLFWVIFYGFATYGNAGFMREQVCQYMCPYARFQSAMFDADTLIVAYDQKRGESRMPLKQRRGLEPQQDDTPGDCIDCGLCVQVCPTGIDIRDGLQYECIACAACIDACDEVMVKAGLPKQLIRYSSENHDNGEDRSLLQSVLRPRILIYGTLLSIVMVGFLVAISMRSSFQVDIIRDRNALYRWVDEQTIANNYRIKMMNKGQLEQRYRVEVEGMPGAEVQWSRAADDGLSLPVAAGAIGDYTVIVRSPASATERRVTPIELIFTEIEGEQPGKVVEESRFWMPTDRR